MISALCRLVPVDLCSPSPVCGSSAGVQDSSGKYLKSILTRMVSLLNRRYHPSMVRLGLSTLGYCTQSWHFKLLAGDDVCWDVGIAASLCADPMPTCHPAAGPASRRSSPVPWSRIRWLSVTFQNLHHHSPRFGEQKTAQRPMPTMTGEEAHFPKGTRALQYR